MYVRDALKAHNRCSGYSMKAIRDVQIRRTAV